MAHEPWASPPQVLCVLLKPRPLVTPQNSSVQGCMQTSAPRSKVQALSCAGGLQRLPTAQVWKGDGPGAPWEHPAVCESPLSSTVAYFMWGTLKGPRGPGAGDQANQ